MSIRILIMGLPGSGKSTLAKELQKTLSNSVIVNGDNMRAQYNDWDFSNEGRLRQAKRIRDKASEYREGYVIADFVAPLPESRDIFNPDWIVWLDTIKKSRFEDTNELFVPPKQFNIKITKKNAINSAKYIQKVIL